MKNFFNLRDSYKEYKTQVREPVDIKIYISIVNGFMLFLVNKLFNKGEIALPERLGNLHIVGKKIKVHLEDGKIKGLAPDWKETNKLWAQDEEAKNNKQLVYHFNEQTNGIRYRFFWSKNRALVPNKTLYSLKMTRTNKRNLAKLVKEGKEYQIKD
jgi:hypothetical protein